MTSTPPPAQPPAAPATLPPLLTESEGLLERLLLKDYDSTMAFVDKMDGQLMAIRNLAIVVPSTVVAYAVSEHRGAIALGNLVIIPAFMLLELVYKCFHEDGIRRTWALEELIQNSLPHGSVPAPYRFGLGHCIHPVNVRDILNLARAEARWHLRLLYLLLLLMTFAGYWLASEGV